MPSLFFSFAVSPVLTLCKNLQILFINLFYVKSTPIKSKNMDSKPRLTVFLVTNGYHPTRHCYTEVNFVKED